MKNIQFITALHGDEQIPVRALASINANYIVANPEALAKNVRFIDMDMNKAFGEAGETLEEQSARKLLSTLKKLSPDYVVDFHTTSATTEPFAIIVDPKLLPVAQTLGVKHVVYMKHNIKKGHSLINYYPGVSIEAGNHDDQNTFGSVIQIAQNALQGKIQEVSLYEVYGTITTAGKYVNFQAHNDGFIPVLAGERAYNFFGLKARKVDAFS